MKKFIGADREQRMLMSYDLGDWLPDHHLASVSLVRSRFGSKEILLIGKELGLVKLGNIYIEN